MKQNKPADQDRLLSPPTFLRLAKPGAFSLIHCRRRLSHHGIPRELVVFPLPDAGTSLDIGLNARHIVVREDGRGARGAFDSITVTAGAGSRTRVRVWLLERFEGPESTTVADNPVQSNR